MGISFSQRRYMVRLSSVGIGLKPGLRGQNVVQIQTRLCSSRILRADYRDESDCIRTGRQPPIYPFCSVCLAFLRSRGLRPFRPSS